MKNNLEQAKNLLKSGNYTCVLSNGEDILTSFERGVKPLLGFLETKRDFSAYSAADKVVGRGAAFLYVLLGIKILYADVLSEGAKSVLEAHGTDISFGELTPVIRNRRGDGICPMEEATNGITEPSQALYAILKRLEELK